MTVAELIEALKTMPPDANVLTEGCDCHGEVGGAALGGTTEPNAVLVYRPDGDFAFECRIAAKESTP
jgi:hypothetical protein